MSIAVRGGAFSGGSAPTYRFTCGGLAPRPVLAVRLGFRIDPSTDAVITWLREGNATPLEWRQAGGTWARATKLPSRDFPLRAERVHSAAITGLTPGLNYEVRVLGDPSEAVRTFRTAAPAGSAIKLAVASDFHPSSISDVTDPAGRFRTMLAAVAASGPDVVVWNGDWLEGNGVATFRNSATWNALVDTLAGDLVRPDGTMIPLLSSIGNHDARGGDSGGSFLFAPETDGDVPYLGQLFDTFWRSGANVGGDGWGWWSAGSRLLCIQLDTGHHTPLAEQIAWARAVLDAQAANYAHVLVYGHMSALSTTYYTGYDAPTALRTTLFPYLPANCRLVVGGHDHTATASLGLDWSATESPPVYGFSAAAGEGVRLIGNGGFGAPTPFDLQSAGVGATGSGGVSWVDFAVGRDQVVGSPTNAPTPSGGAADAGCQNWWQLDFGATSVRARCHNLAGTTYYDEVIALPA